jgi:hypothetical protein
MAVMFNAYWYIDETTPATPLLKFKTPSDFITTPLDLSANFAHKQIKNYNFKMNYLRDWFALHSNNYRVAANDWLTGGNTVEYDRVSKDSNKIETIPFHTYPLHRSDFESDGWFLAYINVATGIIEAENGYRTSTMQDNGKLCQANLMNAFYRDYLYTDRVNYSVAEDVATSAPEHYRNFIELQDVEHVLPSIATFTDSLIWKKDLDYNYIARVFEQSTNLATNITIFKSYDFTRIATGS